MSERPIHKVVLDDEAAAPPVGAGFTLRFEDAALVQRVRDGDTQAFALLMSKYQDKVYNTCWRMCGHPEDARDLTQEAFFRAYQGLSSFKGQSGFYTWVFRIAVNLALSHRRKAGYRTAQSLDQPVGHGSQAESLLARMADRSAGNPDGRVMHAELQEQVEAALESLDPEHRTVVVLREIEGMDYAEIADVLEVAVGTVKSRLFRARAALRERLGAYVKSE